MSARNVAVLVDLLASSAAGQHLDHVTRLVWQGFGSGEIEEDEAASLVNAIERKRPKTEHGLRQAQAPRFPRRRVPTSPDRMRSLARRRRLAAAGPMPPALAAQFTVGELAALKVVADQVRRDGHCALAIDAIAGRAGVGRTTVQNALRAARFAQLIKVEERRRAGLRNLPNLVRIVSKGWLAWLAHRPLPASTSTGFRMMNTTSIKGSGRGESGSAVPDRIERAAARPDRAQRVLPGPFGMRWGEGQERGSFAVITQG